MIKSNPLTPMNDLIVIIPGIMGSTLVNRDGNELWGVRPGTLLRSIINLGRNFDQLRLPVGIGDEPASDGVKPGVLLPIPHVVGRLLGSDGYGHLIAWLQKTFDLRLPRDDEPGNLVAFPYDWRLSNRQTAKRIEAELVPYLDAWRKANGNADAKFRFICHSMGGLVARWFTEVMGGHELTRQIITLGTPHRGAAESLVQLSNGMNPGFGPLRIELTEIIRSLPSVHQLLPTYRCVETSEGLKHLGEVDLPNINRDMLSDALAFHEDILSHAKTNNSYNYRKFALKGISQPTISSVRLKHDALEPLTTLGEKDWAGDGTVPRISSHPPEWNDDSYAPAFGQQHASLQSDGNLHRQLFAILTADQIENYAGGTENLFGLDLPEIVSAGERLKVSVVSPSGDTTLPLRANLMDEIGNERDSFLMRNLGDGRYFAMFEDVPPGLVSVTVASATPHRPLSPVTGCCLVWNSVTATEELRRD